MRSKVLNNLKLFLVCALFGTAFTLVYSMTTSPLLKDCWAGDSAFFILVGQGMTKGLLPYADFYDFKGPYIFFIEYLAQMICYGRGGIFIVQSINFSLCLFVIGKTTDLFAKRLFWLHRIIAFVLTLAVIAMTFQRGNFTEEHSLLPAFLCLYLGLKYFCDTEEKNSYRHPLGYSFVYGLSVGYICFIRITNAAIIGAVLTVVFLFLLTKNEIRNALCNLAMVFAGFASAVVMPCIYFYSKGLLNEMISQVFLFAFSYTTETSVTEKISNVFIMYKFLLLFLLLPVAVSFIYREKWYIRLLSICSTLLLLVAVTMGNAYIHYMTIVAPHVALSTYIAYRNSEKNPEVRKSLACIICFTMVFALNASSIAKTVFKCSDEKWVNTINEFNELALDVAAHIPEDEKNSVYGFGNVSWAKWYVLTGTMPANRYMDFQRHYIELKPEINDEISSWIAEDGARWIVFEYTGKFMTDEVKQAIVDNYTKVYFNRRFVLFRRNS